MANYKLTAYFWRGHTPGKFTADISAKSLKAARFLADGLIAAKEKSSGLIYSGIRRIAR